MNLLQHLCLHVIAEEFDRFFTVLNDENYRRNFVFLQKRYSSVLTLKLFERDKLKDEYLEFLLNEYLNYLDEQWLERTCYRNSPQDVYRRLPNLTEVYCLDITNEILENISKFCPKIAEIYGTCASATDDGVKYLCKKENTSIACPHLKKLYLKNSYVSIEGVKILIQNLEPLEILDHPSVPLALYSLYKEHLPQLENVPKHNLIKLNLLYVNDTYIPKTLPYYNVLLKICLTVCPKLKYLSCSITDKKQLNLLHNLSLKELTVTFMNQKIKRKFNIDNFLINCGRNLISLKVDYCIMSMSQLVTNCRELYHLAIGNVTFADDNYNSGTVFPNLVTCIFHNIPKNRASIKATNLLLLSSPKLTIVTFNFCDLSQATKETFLRSCKKCPLERIYFDGTRTGLHFLKLIIINCPTLIALYLKRCHYSLQEENELVHLADKMSNKPRIVSLDMY